MLQDVLGLADYRPPIPEVDELREYLILIEDGEQDSNRAQELRAILHDRYQDNEPQLNKADRRIRNRDWLTMRT